MSKIEEGSLADQLKKAGMPDSDRIFYMIHGYHNIKDFAGTTLEPRDRIAYAVNAKLRHAEVVGASWESEKKTFRLIILTEYGRTMYIDPNRCVKV